MYTHKLVITASSNVASTLEQMGSEGWELVSVVPSARLDERYDDYNERDITVKVPLRELYFKKRLEPKSVPWPHVDDYPGLR